MFRFGDTSLNTITNRVISGYRSWHRATSTSLREQDSRLSTVVYLVLQSLLHPKYLTITAVLIPSTFFVGPVGLMLILFWPIAVPISLIVINNTQYFSLQVFGLFWFTLALALFILNFLILEYDKLDHLSVLTRSQLIIIQLFSVVLVVRITGLQLTSLDQAAILHHTLLILLSIFILPALLLLLQSEYLLAYSTALLLLIAFSAAINLAYNLFQVRSFSAGATRSRPSKASTSPQRSASTSKPITAVRTEAPVMHDKESHQFSPARATQTPVAVIDGSNIAWTGRSPKQGPDISRLLYLRKQLIEEHGVTNVITVVSAAFYHQIKENDRAVSIYQTMLEKQDIVVAPADTDDDTLIIDLATENDAAIITNDQFKDHKRERKDLGKYLKTRRITAAWMAPNNKFSFNRNIKHINRT